MGDEEQLRLFGVPMGRVRMTSVEVRHTDIVGEHEAIMRITVTNRNSVMILGARWHEPDELDEILDEFRRIQSMCTWAEGERVRLTARKYLRMLKGRGIECWATGVGMPALT